VIALNTCRLIKQCFALVSYYTLCADQCNAVAEEHEEANLKCLAEQTSMLHPMFPCGRTLYEWHRHYNENECHFSLDGRGKHERSWILNEEDLFNRFDAKIKTLVAKEASIAPTSELCSECQSSGPYNYLDHNPTRT